VPDPGADEYREGNLWVGTNGGGLERVQRRVFELERVAPGIAVRNGAVAQRGHSRTLWDTGRNGAPLRSNRTNVP